MGDTGADRVDNLAGPDASAPIVAPAWQERAPDEPWCPLALEGAIPWARDFAYADVSAAQSAGPSPWSLVGASRRGRLHGHRAEFREDAFRLQSGDRFFLLVAADGAGSCRLSRIGAEFTCRAIADELRRALVGAAIPGAGADAARAWIGATVGDGVAVAVRDLASMASAAGIAPREFRTTVLVAVWWQTPAGDFLAAAQVGDGFIAIRRRDGRVERVGPGDVSEFSGEVSCFVPDEGAAERARATTVLDGADIAAIVLGTDGVEDPFYPIERNGPLLLAQLAEGVSVPAPNFQRQDPHGPVFAPDGEAHLLRWLGFERRGENDDRTLVAAWR